MGDASAEEDYALGALGWAATKNLPILFVVEDNNLSILTEKRVRRCWEMHDVAKSFGMSSRDLADDPFDLKEALTDAFQGPKLINVNTHRKFWHSGAGIDDENTFDRYEKEMSLIGSKAKDIDTQSRKEVQRAWEIQLEKQ